MRIGRPLLAALSLVVAWLAAGAPPAEAARPVYVVGDSLGVGIAWSSDGRSLAENSIAIRSRQFLRQLARVPDGAIAFVSLGTNDAVGKVVNVTEAVERIVSAARERDIRLVWIGPPCVLKAWDSSAEELDRRLAAQLRDAGVTYVSMRDPALCERSVRARDGIHFTNRGYAMMWAKAATAAGLLGDAPEPRIEPAIAPEAATPVVLARVHAGPPRTPSGTALDLPALRMVLPRPKPPEVRLARQEQPWRYFTAHRLTPDEAMAEALWFRLTPLPRPNPLRNSATTVAAVARQDGAAAN